MKLYLIKQFSVTFITQTYLKLSDYCLISLEVSTTLHQTYNLLTCISDLFRKEPPVLYVTSTETMSASQVLEHWDESVQHSTMFWYQELNWYTSRMTLVEYSVVLEEKLWFQVEVSCTSLISRKINMVMGPLVGDNLLGRHTFKAASGEPIDIKFMVFRRVGFGFI